MHHSNCQNKGPLTQSFNTYQAVPKPPPMSTACNADYAIARLHSTSVYLPCTSQHATHSSPHILIHLPIMLLRTPTAVAGLHGTEKHPQ